MSRFHPQWREGKAGPDEPQKVGKSAVERLVKCYHGCEVVASRYADAGPYPWTFTVKHNGALHRYGGIPNKCETAASALRRGWWRAKWLAEGTYDQHYT